MKSIRHVVLLPLLALIANCTVNDPIHKVELLIYNTNLIDVQNGKVYPDQYLAIDEGRIVGRGEVENMRYQATQTVNGQGGYVMPGLWDMHVHFGGGEDLIEDNKALLGLYLAHGVTTVRDAAADLSDTVLAWRAQIANGELTGPRIFTSGPKLEGKDSIWPGDLEVETVAEMHAAMDKLDAMQVDYIKITDSAMTPELYLQAVKEVKSRGYNISGHIPFELSVTDVSDAGLDAIEHMSYLLKAAAKNEEEISERVASGELSYRSALPIITRHVDKQTALSKYKVLAKNDTAVVPTMIGSQIIAYLDEEDHLQDQFLQYLGQGLIDTYEWRVERAGKDDAEAIRARKQQFQVSASLLPWLQQSGVRIIAGTDAGFLNSYIYPGLSLHQELQIYVESGLSPLQAIQSAVLSGPAFLNRQADYGSLYVGKVADILLLTQNPLEDIRHTRRISGVVAQGRYFNQNDLQELLDKAETYASSTRGN
ncbi:amidohydrolase family protein [Lacimicrobium alkaliphilum]|uniref:amidohydrolase family protein n=1 Tax=Lacimicrobium alkaliphilum TaxID=1526571 RepID=UPI001E41087F|nr:amidohydrolase family protein [Lacimicrobium alkaliphilum]